MSAAELAEALQLRPRLVADVLGRLAREGLAVREWRYVMARRQPIGQYFYFTVRSQP